MLNKNKISDYCRLMRLPAVFSSLSNILAAYLIATQGDIDGIILLQLLVASACLYLGGMVLNDYYDVEEDRKERPNRPIPSGQINLKTAGNLGYALITLGIIFAGFVGTTSLLIAIVLSICIVAYDRMAKSSYIGVVLMGSCRSLNWLLGLSAEPLAGLNSFLLILPIFFYISGLTSLSRVETTAKSKIALYFCVAGLMLSAFLITALVNNGVLTHNWPLVLLVYGFCLVLIHLHKTWMNFTPQNIQKSIMIMLMGVIPFDAIMAFAGGPWWGGFLVACLWFPGRILSRKMYVT